jgi:hypothetical protein
VKEAAAEEEPAAASGTAYMPEWLKQNAIAGLPGPKTSKDLYDGFVASAAGPLLITPKLPGAKDLYPMIRKAWLERKAQPQH